MDFIGTLGRGSVAGVLVGIVLTIWVKPATTEGQLLLVFVSIAVCVLLTAIIRLILLATKTRSSNLDSDESI